MTHYIIKLTSITLVLFIVSMWTILFFLPIPPLLTGLSYSRAVYDEQHQLLRLTLSQDSQYRLFVPLSEISPKLVSATLLQEDQYFFWHIGVNPISLVKAVLTSYVAGSRRIGASTITMQVARMRYGMNSKTLRGKIWQIIRAMQLETHYSKNQILEAYLNLAPYGNNIEGAGTASLIYYGKPARELTLPDALTLAVIPQNPTKRVPNHSALKNIRNRLYVRWVQKHPDDLDKKFLMKLPLQMRQLHTTPFVAPHFVNEILSNKVIVGNQIVTTLDSRLQKIIERVTRSYMARKMNLGVTNAAILLVDTRDMGIKAMLGSADFFNQKIGGQINGTAIKRSPGSTLKPFIYALALDQGLIHPATVLKDVSRSFGSYNPENFDNDFVGPIKARDALVLSRNIPAIYLAEQLKNPSLYDFLQQAGIQGLKSESYYGLALVLGGAELSMQELSSLYAALVNNGVWQPLRFLPSAEQNSRVRKRLLSPEASFLVMDMLKASQHSGITYFSPQEKQMEMTWKTGTSSGYRDAWTIGTLGSYVLAVWIGNFNNQGNQAFIGKEIAAPLFFEIASAIKQVGNLPLIYKYPERMHLTKVDVCKPSGMLPTRYCTDTEKVWFISGKSPIKTDTIYREIAINGKTGLRACRFDQNTRFEVYEFWSSDLLKIFKRAGIQRRMPPPYDADCNMGASVGEGIIPQIISPQTQVNYVIRLKDMQQAIIPLSAVVDADVRNIYWFVNETFLGKSSGDKALLWHAQPGKFVIRAVDDYGRADARDVEVHIES
ncbi:MAG: penicillin-binding protein 1C [Gammaproteobacteria bacterium]|nr:penicillin-binding protein 1C [Gammaproteobacteria bacterium]MCW5582378.1 penicillin-binding protein 1C [Gammaproteobacteria bacterium]